jgi:hypothetical protein
MTTGFLPLGAIFHVFVGFVFSFPHFGHFTIEFRPRYSLALMKDKSFHVHLNDQRNL